MKIGFLALAGMALLAVQGSAAGILPHLNWRNAMAPNSSEMALTKDLKSLAR